MNYLAGDATQKAAQEALQCQNACNLSGVVHSMSRWMTEIRQEQPMGTDDLNRHPVVVLFADKIAQLAGVQNIGSDGYMKAHDGCTALAAGQNYNTD